MTIVGAFARIDVGDPAAVRQRLASIAGLELFDLDEPGKVGLLLETETVGDAHSTIRGLVGHVEGVLGVWPVYVHDQNHENPSNQES